MRETNHAIDVAEAFESPDSRSSEGGLIDLKNRVIKTDFPVTSATKGLIFLLGNLKYKS